MASIGQDKGIFIKLGTKVFFKKPICPVKT